MAIGDSLQQLIATQRAARKAGTAQTLALEKEKTFAPVLQQLRKLVGSVDGRYVKHKLTKSHAIIRVGEKTIDLGWDIQPNPALGADPGAPPLKVQEARNFMRDDRQDAVLWFTEIALLISYLEQEITRQTSTYAD